MIKIDFKDLTIGFTEIKDGNMSYLWGEQAKVLEARGKVFAEIGGDVKTAFALRPQDTAKVYEVNESDRGRGMEEVHSSEVTDVAVTEENIPLFLASADCIPAIYFDKRTKRYALAHLSWLSIEKKIPKKVIEKFVELDSDPKDIFVYLGPGIKKENFSFTNPIQRNLPGWEPFLKDLENGETSIDIYGYAKFQITSVGVPEENIEESNINIAEDERFFSHYRSARTGEKEGRLGAIVLRR